MNNPLISICIPAYKNEDLLVRLLDSIQIQNFRDFEVVITDDSPERQIATICDRYKTKFPLSYYWNQLPLGTPTNWNFAISKAKGEWIKIMHADDWFVNDTSLQNFAEASKINRDFIFSAYHNVDSKKTSSTTSKLTLLEKSLLKSSPYNLFKKNFIGHPSTTLIRRTNNQIVYDEKIKWVVDFDYYIRYLSINKAFSYIDIPLINIGIHENQVTKSAFKVKKVEIPENFYLLNKIGIKRLKNIYVYDYYWRLLRNLDIRNKQDLLPFIEENSIPLVINQMINIQSKVANTVLKNGIISKALMASSFFINYVKS